MAQTFLLANGVIHFNPSLSKIKDPLATCVKTVLVKTYSKADDYTPGTDRISYYNVTISLVQQESQDDTDFNLAGR